MEAVCVSRWWGRGKRRERERLAALAGEASADAAVAMEAASLATTEPETKPDTEQEPHEAPKPPPVPQDLTAAAFFDVDNTMMMGASIFHFARGLAARKYFTTSDLAGFAWQQVKFRVGGRENSDGMPPGASRRCPSSRAARSTRWSRSARRSTTS